MPRIVFAFILSVLFFFLFMFIGETSASYLGDAGFVITFVLMAANFFVCQFRLSRGNAGAPRKDWPIMLALNAVPLVMVILMIMNEKWPVILVQGLIILLAGWGGAFAGAVLASRAARKRQGAQ
jgi:amino acid transporter